MLTFNTCLTCQRLKGNLFSLYVTPIKLGSYRSSVSGAFLYVRNRFPTCHDVRSCDRGCLASDLETSDLETSDLETSDPLKND